METQPKVEKAPSAPHEAQENENNQIFGTPDALTTAQYQTMSFHWLLLNGVRMVLVGTALLSLLQVRLLLSKMSTET